MKTEMRMMLRDVVPLERVMKAAEDVYSKKMKGRGESWLCVVK